MKTLKTERLILRPFTIDDAAFALELLNEPDFHRFVGDRGVRTTEQAAEYLKNGPMAAYEQGFGLLCVEEAATGESTGMCGLIRRDELPDVDLGFSFLERFRRKGYASESSKAVIEQARSMGLERLAAITDPTNAVSEHLLQRLGFRVERQVRMGQESIDLNYLVLEL